jgi:hypothetical protein
MNTCHSGLKADLPGHFFDALEIKRNPKPTYYGDNTGCAKAHEIKPGCRCTECPFPDCICSNRSVWAALPHKNIELRNQTIKDEYNNGTSVVELSSTYQLSPRWIRKIVKVA